MQLSPCGVRRGGGGDGWLAFLLAPHFLCYRKPAFASALSGQSEPLTLLPVKGTDSRVG